MNDGATDEIRGAVTGPVGARIHVRDVGRTVGSARVTVEVPGDPTAVRVGEPVTFGLPLPQGLCADEGQISVVGGVGAVPVQVAVLERWPDSTIRWVLLDFQANAPAAYDVRFGAVASPASAPLTLRDQPDAVEVEVGGLAFRTNTRGEFRLEARQRAASGDVVRSVGIDLTRPDGTVVRPDVTEVAWETRGRLHSVLRVDGTIASNTRGALRLIARLHFYAGAPTVRFEVTLWNPARAEHPGGIWELGDAGSVLIRDCSIRVETGTLSSLCWSADGGASLAAADVPFELYQDSSGGENWQSPVHLNRDGIIPVSFRGYRVKGSPRIGAGLRATPVLWTEGTSGSTGVAMRYFWQNAPKALEVTDRQIVLRLFPKQFADLHEIQGGEQKTHVFHVAFDADHVSALPLDWTRRPALATVPPAWYCASEAIPYLTPASDDPHRQYVDLMSSIVEGADSFERRREAVDEYGWRNFGDIYADHEAVFHPGQPPLVSHYNNQYDAIAGFASQYLRSSDPRWWMAMEELAWHVRDVDIYHTADDKAAFNGGLFWHTFHYVAAGRSSHRAYPKTPGVPGGGPANEHSYSTGLMLHYLLTGESASRDAAIEMAECVLGMDDGGRTPFRWLSRGDTGLASATYTPLYHGPGRGAGNAIAVLLNGYRLSGRTEFLNKAEGLIRRCIHPQDTIASRELTDPEHRWSYTVFLQVLGRYLDEKRLRNAVDQDYSYARESLLHYARWMAHHEYPYLEKPERLEYPTETWAAQEMRKSDVFKFASKHATGAERERFRERASFFFDRSIQVLLQHPTHLLARPRVILMGCGYMQAAFQTWHPGLEAPAGPAVTFGSPPTFVPQKLVARRRVMALGIAGVALLAALLVLVLRADDGGATPTRASSGAHRLFLPGR